MKHHPIFDQLSKEVLPIPGIYLLLQDNKVVYVGQTKDVRTRVMQHAAQDIISFNDKRVLYIRRGLKAIERDLIAYYLPEHNSDKHTKGLKSGKKMPPFVKIDKSVVNLEAGVHKSLKSYCARHGLKIQFFVEGLIKEAIIKQKR